MENHLCLSGTPTCSGINPCGACHQVYLTKVLPKAMVAGGFNGNAFQAQSFFSAYAEARRAILAELPSMLQPTLNAAPPPPPPEVDPELVEELPPQPLTDEELAAMAGEPTPEAMAWKEMGDASDFEQEVARAKEEVSPVGEDVESSSAGKTPREFLQRLAGVRRKLERVKKTAEERP